MSELQKLRDLGYSYSEIAGVVGKSRQYIRKVLSNYASPTFEEKALLRKQHIYFKTQDPEYMKKKRSAYQKSHREYFKLKQRESRLKKKNLIFYDYTTNPS